LDALALNFHERRGILTGAPTMIEVKHGSHKITYDEASNTWSCKAMRCDAPSLAALRTKLNNEDREDRRIGNIRAFSMDRGYENTEIIITMIDTGARGVNGYRVGSSGNKREYFSLGSLVLLNDKNAPKIKKYKDACAAHEAAELAMYAAREALPHPTVEELQKLSAAQTTKAVA
jgi:hypothetical protein